MQIPQENSPYLVLRQKEKDVKIDSPRYNESGLSNWSFLCNINGDGNKVRVEYVKCSYRVHQKQK